MKRPAQKQYAVPYFMSSHPGCTHKRCSKAGGVCAGSWHYTPEQVQDFYPTPSTTFHLYVLYRDQSTDDGKPVYVPKDPHEKAIQRALMQYKNPANRELVLEGLQRGRPHGSGRVSGPKCLIRPEKKNSFSTGNKNSGSSRRPAHRTTIRNTHKKQNEEIRHLKEHYMSKTKKRNSSRKRDYGYLASEKKRRILITAVLLAVPLADYFLQPCGLYHAYKT